jgi:hypothetical protein
LAETAAALTSANSSLKNCNGNWSSSDHSQDCGYSSENNNGCCDTGSTSSSLPSSPEGSEVACSDGFCNHEGNCDTPVCSLAFVVYGNFCSMCVCVQFNIYSVSGGKHIVYDVISCRYKALKRTNIQE